MAEDTPSKTERKSFPRMAANAVGATASVAGDRISGAAVGAVQGITQRVVSPIIQTAMLQQMPMVGAAFNAISGILGDIKEKAMEKERMMQEKQNADRIGLIADNTGETVENLDDLEGIMSSMTESVYEGVYEGIQDGISKLVGDFFEDVGEGVTSAIEESGHSVETILQTLQEKFMDRFSGPSEFEDDDDATGDALLGSVQNIESMIKTLMAILLDDISDSKFDKKESAMEARRGKISSLKTGEEGGLEGILGKLSGILNLLGITRIFSVIAGAVGILMSGLGIIGAGLAALATPIGLVVAAVAVIVGAVTYVAWKLGDGDIIKGFKIMGDWIWKTLTELPQKVIDWIKGIPGRVMDFLKDPIGNIQAQSKNLVDSVMWAYEGFTSFFHDEIEAVKGFVTKYHITDLIESILNAPYAALKSGVDVIDTLIPGTKDKISEIWDTATDRVMDFVHFLADLPGKALEWLKDQVRGIPFIGEHLIGGEKGDNTFQEKALKSVEDFGKNVSDGIGNWFKNTFSKDEDDTKPSMEGLNKLISSQDMNEVDVKQLVTSVTDFLKNIPAMAGGGAPILANQSNVTNNVSNVGQTYIPRPNGQNSRKIMEGY